jgi:YYY domain-containing protein
VEPITEFPFFTFTYGDLHAHMLALPLTLLALTWALAVVLGKARWRSLWDGALAFLFGGLVFGVLRPTNTWDYPTYLALGVVALIYAVWRNHQPQAGSLFACAPRWAGAGITALSAAVWLGALSWFLFQPYTHWYALGYADVNVWNGGQTPLGAFLVHWAIFLLPIISWMLWETRAWLAATPASTGLRALRRLREWIVSGLIILLTLAAGLTYFYEIKIAWFVLPLAAWAAVLLLRPGMPDAKRAVLFLIGTGLFLTLLVETIVLTGDIGRMNTVFKFYLQVWIIFGVAAAASLGWLIPAVGAWQPWVARSWRAAFGVLVFLGAMYPLTAGLAKIKDRMAEHAPAALDGMAYMEYAITFDQDRQLTLSEDYRAILWMQENVTGTPVIVEAQVVEYHWGSRFSIYTGLPAVLGWNWHQRQQRTGHDGDVWLRDGQIEEFYTTTNVNIANNFLAQYGVRYIIVGQLERAYHNGPGLEKFETYDGMFWREVYRDGETVIYEVMRGE